MLKAIEQGYPQKEIGESAYRFQLQLEKGERTIVGVNKHTGEDKPAAIPVHKVDLATEAAQIARLKQFKAGRDTKLLTARLSAIRTACAEGKNIMPSLIEGVSDGVTLGEVSDIFREVFGVYHDPGFI